jgi:hypothetical protein
MGEWGGNRERGKREGGREGGRGRVLSPKVLDKYHVHAQMMLCYHSNFSCTQAAKRGKTK